MRGKSQNKTASPVGTGEKLPKNILTGERVEKRKRKPASPAETGWKRVINE